MSIILPSDDDIQRFGGETGRRMFLESSQSVQDRVGDLEREEFNELTRWMTVKDKKGNSFMTRSGMYAKPVRGESGDESRMAISYYAPDPGQEKFDGRTFRRSIADVSRIIAEGLHEKLRTNIIAVATSTIPEWAREELRALLAGEIEPDDEGDAILLPGQVDLFAAIRDVGALTSLGNTFRKNTTFTRARAAMVLGVIDRMRKTL